MRGEECRRLDVGQAKFWGSMLLSAFLNHSLDAGRTSLPPPSMSGLSYLLSGVFACALSVPAALRVPWHRHLPGGVLQRKQLSPHLPLDDGCTVFSVLFHISTDTNRVI